MQKKTLLWISLTVSLLLAAGCFWAGRAIYCGFYERCPVSDSREGNGIRLTLWSRSEWYEVGETVFIRATVENISDQTITLISPSGEPVFDIKYRDESGEYVRWSQKNPGLAASSLTLEPGEKFETVLGYILLEYAPYNYTASIWTRQQGTLRWDLIDLILSIGYGGYRY